mmetsp:Transcript_414/g.1009  ORF Transcript_414/g.1009 Transcript_414/m.1009 type:complete len:224 (+) Transcript_414:1150-1821(+)
MLHNDEVVVRLLQRSDHVGSVDALPNVKVGRGLVEHVDVRVLHAEHADGEALELTTRQVLDLTFLQVVQLQLSAQRVLLLSLVFLREDLPDLAGHLLRDLVHVLRLDHGLEAVLQQALDVRLQLAAAEVGEDLLPVGRRVVPAKVGLQLPGQDRQRGRLADAVRSHEAQDLPWPGRRQPVQLEGVCAVTVRRVLRQVLRKVDDGDRLEGALLHADTAAYAQGL